jgi:hypothetical protein
MSSHRNDQQFKLGRTRATCGNLLMLAAPTQLFIHGQWSMRVAVTDLRIETSMSVIGGMHALLTVHAANAPVAYTTVM